MRNLKSKDLMLIFLIISSYIILYFYHLLNFNKSILEFIYIIFLFLFSGYPLIILLRHDRNYKVILKNPVLLLLCDGALILLVSIILKFLSLGPQISSLTLFLSIITLFLTITAYVHRIKYLNSIQHKLDLKTPEKSVNDNIVIRVENVGMRFNLSKERIDNLKEYFIKFLKRKISSKEFWALKNISFEVKKGERWGIVGLNGSGKSTLLKIVSGVMKPTEGSCKIEGKLVPLLELGAGFDPNYTGRENIFLNGAMLGFSKEFLEEKYEEIVEFSGVKKFIDVPLKNYSSGMRARLGFSIATMVKPEILILDEVLSVGDAKFREKSEKKILSLFDQGITVLFVSHSAEQVKRICNKAIWLEDGKIIMKGNANDVCYAYALSVIKMRNENVN